MDLIHQRRSVRAYSEQQVAESVPRELLDAAVQAPTAVPRQAPQVLAWIKP